MNKTGIAIAAIFLAAAHNTHAQVQTFSLNALNSVLAAADASATGNIASSSCSIAVYNRSDWRG
jgi:hypothetical protein